ncbi:Uncharacterised protein [Blautia wexlerae]|jgi:hypothetical protein|uniref:DUF4340 domain-containing protein n=1 Tax=Blautia wexlerae TaxID=418240 RepID=A0A174D8D2_9FIRM|nr:DUF4340 domain-containing protein [Blautia wexlerae]MCB5515309.1 DUF4340 domain-containing protein [Blautia wexlerae]NSJ82978.1 DUF4340 domain-containing protein [Blautia wexlerae]NSK56542.1 DUF4340 domain-containing protein [Blautia wexlerae]NSK59608.1 DUF4340 domain-containing protein [Blautia wexlerae]CUO21891.1 Uncharacterised protein [Blautia wexlerae]
MKNKTVKMVLAVVVLGVCCGAYAGVKTYVAHQEQKESEEDSEESTTVFTASTDNIKSLDFMVDDTKTTFEKDDDSWVKKDETDFPVNQTTLDSAASAIASVDSDRVLEDVDDLSEYGLDSPSNTIKIVTKSDEEDGDDITTTLYVGDENSSTSQYYVRKDDDEKTVYLIDSSCVEPFTKSLNDYAQMDDFPAISNTDTITKISVDGDNSYELSKDEDTSTWSVKGSEDEEKADSATVSSLVSSFGSMAYSSLADYKCDDKSKYGLDKPYATITVDYQEEVADDDTQDNTTAPSEAADEDASSAEENSDDAKQDTESDDEDSSEEETKMADKQLTILVGNKTDDSNRYVMVNDSNEVYTMSTDSLSALTDKSEEDFWDMTVSYVSLNSLGSLKVNYQGSDYKVNVSRETSTDDDGNDTETVTYKLNGSDLDETTFTTFYNKLINMTAQKRLTDKYEPDGDAELTATFTEEDGDTQEVAYYSYDTNYYAAVVDNKVYLVNKMNVKELFTAFESVAGTEEDNSGETDSEEATTDDTKSDLTDTSSESIEE